MTEPHTVEQMIQAVATDPDSLPDRDDSIRQRAFIDIVSRSMMVVKLLARRTPDDNADNVSEEIATMLGIPRALAAEIMYENDESLTAGEWHAVPRSDLELVPHWQVPSILVRDPPVDERRWRYMRNWVASQIKETA